MWDLKSRGCGLGGLRGWLANQQNPQINLPLMKDLHNGDSSENFVHIRQPVCTGQRSIQMHGSYRPPSIQG